MTNSNGELFTVMTKEVFDVKWHFSLSLKMRKQLPVQVSVCLPPQKRKQHGQGPNVGNNLVLWRKKPKIWVANQLCLAKTSESEGGEIIKGQLTKSMKYMVWYSLELISMR